MKLVIVSGLSGSGKSIALNTLEDSGYFCVDNLPVGLLADFVSTMKNSRTAVYEKIAVAVDARCGTEDMGHFEHILKEIKSLEVDVAILFLSAQDGALLTRFNETRRKHPLSHNGLTLIEAINTEREILLPISSNADHTIDTTQLNVHELRDIIKNRLIDENSASMTILIQSFGFKHGLPADTDFMFDVRCLPNPHGRGRDGDGAKRDRCARRDVYAQETVSRLVLDEFCRGQGHEKFDTRFFIQMDSLF